VGDEAAELAKQYEGLSDDELAEAAASSYELTEAIMSAYPQMAQDAGFELFDRRWAQRYWRSLAHELGAGGGSEQLKSWAVDATIAGVANLIVVSLGVPAIALSSAVALAVILLRASKSSAATSDVDDSRSAPEKDEQVAIQSAHRPEPGLQPPMIGFDWVVRLALDGVQR
jgi:hypothetical protein